MTVEEVAAMVLHYQDKNRTPERSELGERCLFGVLMTRLLRELTVEQMERLEVLLVGKRRRTGSIVTRLENAIDRRPRRVGAEPPSRRDPRDYAVLRTEGWVCRGGRRRLKGAS